MFLIYTVIILHISLPISVASTDFKRNLFDKQKNKRIISSNTTLSIDIVRSSVECAGVCSLVQQCCSTSFETESGHCMLDTQSSPETETTDNSNVMMKIPGNDNLNILTTSRNYVVRFEMHDFDNNTAYAEYQSFKVDNEASRYRVTFTGYTGTAGNGFEVNNGMKFTTRDRDNDLHPYHCGLGQQGAWWYNKCGITSLNGRYEPEGTAGAKMIQWKTWRNTTMRATAIKIRPMN